MLAALPNLLTGLRLIAAPALAALLLYAEHLSLAQGRAAAVPLLWAAFALFAAAACTDAADGWLARRFAATSALGAALDHAADKTLVAAGLFAYAVAWAPLDLIVAGLVIVLRDLAIGGLREGLALSGRKLPVAPVGKAKTISEMVGLGAAFLALPVGFGPRASAGAEGIDLALRWLELVARIGLWAAAALALVSLVLYLRAAAAPPPIKAS